LPQIATRQLAHLCFDRRWELQEGSSGSGHGRSALRVDNLTMIVDRNGLQQGDTTERTMHLEPLVDKFRAFGWAVREVDGHDYAALLQLFATLPFEPGRPNCVIAHTHKGQGYRLCAIEWNGITKCRIVMSWNGRCMN
jgi:transketolase